tara:strand:+ start:38078 stop:38374 length:297 start_codon:yes stop_codon:yes gene_type:complete
MSCAARLVERMKRKISSSARINAVMNSLKSFSTARQDWTRSVPPRRSWKRTRRSETRPEADPRTTIVARPVVAGISNGIMECRTTKTRVTSPIPKAGL